MGTESENDVATPEYAFSAPGPYCMAKTPGGRPLVTLLYPSAIPTPTRSCRHITGRIPAAAQASITGVVGKQDRYSTPSLLSISAIASMVCTSLPRWSGMVWLRVLLVLSRSAYARRRQCLASGCACNLPAITRVPPLYHRCVPGHGESPKPVRFRECAWPGCAAVAHCAGYASGLEWLDYTNSEFDFDQGSLGRP